MTTALHAALAFVALVVAGDPCGDGLLGFANAVFTRCDGFWI